MRYLAVRCSASLVAAALIFFATLTASAQDAPPRSLDALYDELLSAQDPEKAIELGTAALADEKALENWTLATPRGSFRAEVHSAIGRAYINRSRGTRADNVETAIEHFAAALSAAPSPQEASAIHVNLAVAYWNRVRGERVDSEERALSHFESALTTLTRETHPVEWAQITSNMGVLLLTRLRGDRNENVERSIAALEQALTVLKRETQPQLWAVAQSNLGNAYKVRTSGDLAHNFDAATTHLQESLTVFTREAAPVQWAQVQVALSSVLRRRGGPENEVASIERLRGALDVFTREAFPQQWAQTEFEFGNALADRAGGDVSTNRAQAVAAYRSALTVLTLQAAPFNHLQITRRLANVLMESRDCAGAAPVHAAARQAFIVLFGQSIDATETAKLVTEAGPMFADASYCAVERGEMDDAARLANEGRARLLAISLKLQSLRLSPDQQARVDALRSTIRAEQAAVDATHGTDRAEAIDRLAARRQELLEILDSSRSTESTGCTDLTRDASGQGIAIVMPVVTAKGAKLLVCASGAPSWTAVDLPDVTLPRIADLLAGDAKTGKSGWIAAYFANYFQGEEQDKRWPLWLAAVDDIGSQLWGMFGEKFSAALRARNVKPGARVILMPAGRLGVLPLGLAQDPSTKQRLLDLYEVTYAPSLEALQSAREHASQAQPATLAAIVNPTGDLPGTETEGALVASHFAETARTVVERDAASVPNVLAALKGKSYWHFASHGTFAWQDVSSSSLIMAEGERLSISRLSEADDLGRPRLVVLSACETGLSDIVTTNPEEFIGLPGSFVALGAAGVVGTLWPVSDEATALLIAKFYELHLSKGMAPPAALRSAQLWLRDATADDISKFTAGQRMQPRHLAEIEKALDRLGTRAASTSAAGAAKEVSTAGQPSPSADRPFAHPYYWGGFVYTGL